MAVQLCPHVTLHAADMTAKLHAIHFLSFLHWHAVSTDCFGVGVVFLLACLFPFCFLREDGVFLFCPFLFLLILFLLSFWSFCLDFSWATAFAAEKRGVHIFFPLLVLNSSREGAGKLPSSLSAIRCLCSQWPTRRHLRFHIMSAIPSPKWEGTSSVRPQCALPF